VYNTGLGGGRGAKEYTWDVPFMIRPPLMDEEDSYYLHSVSAASLINGFLLAVF